MMGEKITLHKGISVYYQDFINEIKKRPILYDENVGGTRPIKLKQQQWIEIAEKLKQRSDWMIVTALKIKWKSIRDSFTKSYKTYIKRKAQKRRFVTKPARMAELAFIIPHIMADRNNTECNTDNKPNEDKKDNDFLIQMKEELMSEDSNQGDGQDEVFKCDDEEECIPLNKIPDNIDPIDTTPAVIDLTNANAQPYDNLKQCNLDDTDKFFLSLSSAVKRFKPLNQALVKKTISNIIFDMEIREAKE